MKIIAPNYVLLEKYKIPFSDEDSYKLVKLSRFVLSLKNEILERNGLKGKDDPNKKQYIIYTRY